VQPQPPAQPDRAKAPGGLAGALEEGMGSPMDGFCQTFDYRVRGLASTACADYGYEAPTDAFFESLFSRLPPGLRSTLGQGLASGLLVLDGRTFNLSGLASRKGPYNWFARDKSTNRLSVNWEYFVQVAEYIRLKQTFSGRAYTLTFEDGYMDLGLYHNGSLLVCCEIKETTAQAQKLIKEIKNYQDGYDPSAPDRGKDPLRKAKYLVQHRPRYFYVVAIGSRYEFNVTFPENKAFLLQQDVIPFVQSL
jgi:hypothetical protein